MANPLAKLTELRKGAGDIVPVAVSKSADVIELQGARENYRLFVADRRENDGWSDEDVEEYAAMVKADMQDPERAAACVEFWSYVAHEIRERNNALRLRGEALKFK